jgi:hypothetical protein
MVRFLFDANICEKVIWDLAFSKRSCSPERFCCIDLLGAMVKTKHVMAKERRKSMRDGGRVANRLSTVQARTPLRPLRPPRSTLTLRLSDHTTSNPKVPGGDVDPSRIGHVCVHVRTPSILIGTVVELLVLMLMLMLILMMMMRRALMMLMLLQAMIPSPRLTGYTPADGRSDSVEYGRVHAPSAWIGSHRRQAVDEANIIPSRWRGNVSRGTRTSDGWDRLSRSRLRGSEPRSADRHLTMSIRHVLVVLERRSHGRSSRSRLTRDPRTRLDRKTALGRRPAKVRSILRSASTSLGLMRMDDSANWAGIDRGRRGQARLVFR